MPDVFTEGMAPVYEATSLPVIAHNRWWCNETDYGERNGGQYHFLYDDSTGGAVPQDPKFWEDLFKNSSSWGLKVYLQDWLDQESDHIGIFGRDLTVERNWLMQMGDGAAVNDINILYCMSWPRHMMQSVEIQNVVSIRASQDYHSKYDNDTENSNGQWDIGITGIYTFALGLAPFKDTFFTTSKEHDDSHVTFERHPQLEAAMATLSTGIVGISDEIGKTDMDLLGKSMMIDGRILRPSRPLGVPNILIYDLNPRLDLNKTNIFETWSEIATFRFGIILEYNPELNATHRSLYHFDFQNGQDSEEYQTLLTMISHYAEVSALTKWTSEKPLEIPHKIRANPGFLMLMYQSPIWVIGETNVSFLGEVGKWAMVSPVRFKNINLSPERVAIAMEGVPTEIVTMQFTLQHKSDKEPKLLERSCTIPGSGRSTFYILLSSSASVKTYCQDA